MRCIGYARFSPRPNSDECDSVEKQLAAIRQWCQERGHDLVGEFSDKAASGNDRSRVGLFDAITFAKKGDTILVRDWDRFARDRTFAGILIDDLRRKGVEVRSITESGDMEETMETRLLRNILLDIAEYRRGIIAARTRSGMKSLLRRSRYIGGSPPLGWEVRHKAQDGKSVKVLVRNQHELSVVEDIQDLRKEGWTVKQITQYFAALQTQVRGRTVNNRLIRRVLYQRVEDDLPNDSPET